MLVTEYINACQLLLKSSARNSRKSIHLHRSICFTTDSLFLLKFRELSLFFVFAPLHLSLFHFFFDVDGRSFGCSRNFFVYNNDVVLQRNDNRFGSMPACCSRSRSPDPPHWDWLPNHWHNNLNYSSEKSLNSLNNTWTQIFAHTIASIDIAMHADNKDTYSRWKTM